MSCCGRQASAQAQVPQRRAAREAQANAPAPSQPQARAAPGAAISSTATAPGVPPRLVFKGTRPLALPLGARRILVLPGQVLQGLSAGERAALWRTGLFE
jgi:hypothetical protein